MQEYEWKFIDLDQHLLDPPWVWWVLLVLILGSLLYGLFNDGMR